MSEHHRVGVALGVAASVAMASSVFALDATKPTDSAAPANAETQKAAALVSEGVNLKPAGDSSCPSVAIAPGGEKFPKRDDTYKATLEGLARDCANLGAETILKVGLVGEGERDTKKGPSWFNAPLKLSVKDANGNDVETRKIRLKVKLASGELKTAFDHVEENVSLPPPAAGGYAGWSVVVGFDPSVTAAEKPAVSKSFRAAAVRHATRVARAAPRPASPPPIPQPAGPPPTDPNNQSPWQKVAASFTEHQTKAAVEAQKAQLAQAKAQQAQARAQQAQAQVAARQQQRRPVPTPPQPQANAGPRQQNIRTAAGAEPSVR